MHAEYTGLYYGLDSEERFVASLPDEEVRPVEDQAEFDLSGSDRAMFELYDDGNDNEYGGEIGNRDWPVT